MLNYKLSSLFLLGMFSFLPAQAEQTIPIQTKNEALYARLPAEIKEKKVITNVFDGANPPYVMINDGRVEGASVAFANAVGELLGVTVKNMLVDNFAGMLAGIQNGRYQLTIGPVGDYPSRQDKMDFIDFINEYVLFAVNKGNPQKINSIADTCGKRVAVLAGGSAEKTIHQQSVDCIKNKKAAVRIQIYPNVAASILAIRSDRADAVFHALATLSYLISQQQGQLELAGIGQDNGFGRIYQGTALPKNSPLTPVLRDAYQQLFDNGTYAAIMKKWHLENNMLPAPGINLTKE